MVVELKKNEAFRLKMRSLTLPVLQIFDDCLENIEKQLETLKKQTPYLFQCSPMMIDLEDIADKALDLPLLYASLRQYGIIPVGIQLGKDASKTAVGAHYENEAKKEEMAIFSSARLTEPVKEVLQPEPVAEKVTQSNKYKEPQRASKLITKPVRSGQQIYAEGGDLIVVASVSNGAELLADGNIHVYGTLRGRALAGIQGNLNTRIFCQNLDADLVSIAGHYALSDTISRYKENGAQQIFWENNKLQIQAL